MSASPSPVSINEEPSVERALRGASPFAELSDEVIGAIAEAASVRRYEAGETIFAMGQYDGSEFLVVCSGRLKAARADAESGSMLFESIRSGETFFLAEAILGDEQRVAGAVTIAADAPSLVAAVDAEAFRQVAGQRPSLTRALMMHFARKSLGDGRSSEETSPERRVFSALTSLVERDAVSATWRIARMPKHRELADRAGVEEAEAASAVAKLIQSGVARRDYPGLIIDDISRLNRLSR